MVNGICTPAPFATGTRQQFPAHPVQPGAHVPTGSCAGMSPHGAFTVQSSMCGSATTQRVGIVYAVAPGQRRSGSVSRMRPTRGPPGQGGSTSCPRPSRWASFDRQEQSVALATRRGSSKATLMRSGRSEVNM